MRPSVTSASLQLAFIKIVHATGGRARPLIRVTTRRCGSTVLHTVTVAPENRRAVNRYLAQHPLFRLLPADAEVLTLTEELGAALIQLSHQGAERLAALAG
jgi:hypothetical protein